MNSDSLDTNEFIIQSVPWKVREKDGALSIADDAWGYCDFDLQTIFISAVPPYQQRVEILIHEVIHVLVNGWDSCDLTRETTVRIFSVILTDTLIRNGLIPTE
jgi:hypothetical protein